MMPGLTGLELIERVRGDAALYDLPIVVISAHKDYLAKACAGGATRAISKPVEAYNLVSTVLNLVTNEPRGETEH
jgi:CheY-like chemotaxis protein